MNKHDPAPGSHPWTQGPLQAAKDPRWEALRAAADDAIVRLHYYPQPGVARTGKSWSYVLRNCFKGVTTRQIETFVFPDIKSQKGEDQIGTAVVVAEIRKCDCVGPTRDPSPLIMYEPCPHITGEDCELCGPAPTTEGGSAYTETNARRRKRRRERRGS